MTVAATSAPQERRYISPMDVDPAEIAYIPTTGVGRLHETPMVAATDEGLSGYGRLVESTGGCPSISRGSLAAAWPCPCPALKTWSALAEASPRLMR